MAKNHIPEERWRRYETGPPTGRVAFTNKETEALPQILEGIEQDWPIMEGLVANAHQNYAARHFEGRLRNMAAWYQWVEAYLFGEPIDTKSNVEYTGIRPGFYGVYQTIDHIQPISYNIEETVEGRARRLMAEKIYVQKYLTDYSITKNEARNILGLGDITS